jgi:prephenate dehydrogenase
MSEMFEKAAVIGTGLMGGSLALALKESMRVRMVAGYDTSSATRRKARELGIADEMLDSPELAAGGADLLFLATPTSSIVEAYVNVRDVLEKGAIVSDLGSAKLGVTAAIEADLPTGVHYVGGHPMTGSEQSGVESARSDLYSGAYYILTPTENTHAKAFQRLHGLITDLGARVISIDPETHDRAMATVSHVPHLLSLLLMEMASKQREQMKNLFTVSAGGFRDMTRIAASNPDIWVDICMENKRFIIERLEDYTERVADLMEMLADGDRTSLQSLFEEARQARAELSVKSGRELEELYDVSLPVPDEPGVISNISTAVGAIGVNIEDMTIVHPLEGETGIMTLKILGKAQAAEVADNLMSLGYRASFWKA